MYPDQGVKYMAKKQPRPWLLAFVKGCSESGEEKDSGRQGGRGVPLDGKAPQGHAG